MLVPWKSPSSAKSTSSATIANTEYFARRLLIGRISARVAVSSSSSPALRCVAPRCLSHSRSARCSASLSVGGSGA